MRRPSRIPTGLAAPGFSGGRRVPIKALFENLEGGDRVADFLEWFPGIAKEQVDAVLEHAARGRLE